MEVGMAAGEDSAAVGVMVGEVAAEAAERADPAMMLYDN
jgi:hypothetical protein